VAMAGTMAKEMIDFWKLEEFWNNSHTNLSNVSSTICQANIIGFGFAISLKIPLNLPYVDTSVVGGLFGGTMPSKRPLYGLLASLEM
jgi:hypothetical protein